MTFALGCTESYDAIIVGRGGAPRITSLEHTELSWSRSLDETSSADVTVGGDAGQAGSECCAALAEVEPWEVELAIFRNSSLVWVGPVRRTVYDDDGISISAIDLSAWLDRRRIHDRHPTNRTDDDIEVDACDLAASYIADALSVDDSMNLKVEILAPAERIARVVKPRENKMCLPEVGELARTLIDWTVIGRTMFLAGSEIPLDRFRTLVDEHFASLEDLTVDGDQLVTDQIVNGQGTGSAGANIQGEAFASDEARARFGVHEAVVSEDDITTTRQADRAAQTRIDLLGEPAVSFTGGDLDATFPLTVDELIPGTQFSVRLTDRCRPVLGLYRLVGVSASVDHDSDSISISVEPVGTVAE